MACPPTCARRAARVEDAVMLAALAMPWCCCWSPLPSWACRGEEMRSEAAKSMCTRSESGNHNGHIGQQLLHSRCR